MQELVLEQRTDSLNGAKDAEEMTTKQLPQDVISLVHHVQLNQYGWWKKGVSQVLAGLLWKIGTPLKPQDIRQLLHEQLEVLMALDDIQECLRAMVLKGDVSEIQEGVFTLSEAAANELSSHSRAGQAEFDKAKNFFIAEVVTRCDKILTPEEVWLVFVQELTEAVQQTGANTFNLLKGEHLQRREDWLIGFVKRFGSEHAERLKDVVGAFFSSANPEGKQYVLKLLTAYFFVEATQLSKRTIESIDAKRNQRRLRLYLDTNFLFSVLGLHDNPADDAAISLLQLARTAREYIEIKFLVSPHTIDETQRTVAALIETAKQVRVSRALQSAASSTPLPSALKKYFSVSGSASNALSPDDFFGPYARNLKTILRQKGIEVDDQIDVAAYRKDPRVIDDVLDLDKQEQVRAGLRKKSYEAIEHDVVLWYAVNDQRPRHTESPFDAEAWVVTVDSRLAVFDRRKTVGNVSVPTALFPSSLAQLIQFWVPRNEQLEATLLDSLKLPLFFRNFDREDEQATLRILSALSRYRDVEDLGVTTIRDVLVSDALRQRIQLSPEATEDDVFSLVQEEIVQRNKSLSEELEKIGQTAEDLAKSIQRENASRKAAEQVALHALAIQGEAQAKAQEEYAIRVAAEAKVAEESAARRTADANFAQVASRLQALEISNAKKHVIRQFLVGPVIAATLGCFVVGKYMDKAPHEQLNAFWPYSAFFMIGILVSLVSIWRANAYLCVHPELESWAVARWLRNTSTVGFSFLGMGVLPGFAGDVIKKLFGLP